MQIYTDLKQKWAHDVSVLYLDHLDINSFQQFFNPGRGEEIFPFFKAV